MHDFETSVSGELESIEELPAAERLSRLALLADRVEEELEGATTHSQGADEQG